MKRCFASEGADPGGVARRGLARTPAGSFGSGLSPLRLARTEEGEGAPSGASALGFSWAARPGKLGRLRTGLVFEQGSFLGGTGEGAFDGGARRALAFGLHHERPVGRDGRLAVGASHTVDAGHVPGEEETWPGARYRLRF